jgi:hypothetical protein
MSEQRTWNEERCGYDVEGPCWCCGSPIRYFVDEDGTPRDIIPAPPAPVSLGYLPVQARMVEPPNLGDSELREGRAR